MPVVTLLLAALVLLGPPLSVVGMLVWARRLSRQGAPRATVWVASLVGALGGLIVVTGYVSAIITATQGIAGEAFEPSQKARRLAEGISEVMNCGALAVLVVVVGGAGLWFWRWWRGRTGGSG